MATVLPKRWRELQQQREFCFESLYLASIGRIHLLFSLTGPDA